MNQKAQLTVFIIIGLILLISASIVVYFTTKKVVKPVEEAVIVPEDARPVYDFVQGCASDVAHEGIGLLGLQGGFIQLPGIIDRTPTASISIDARNQFKVPLWYYEGEDRTPSVGFMEREITRYVNEHVKDCTGAFEPFAGRFTIAEEANLITKTTLADNEVIVRITWPLALATPERTTRIKDFVIRLPVRLKQMWELANATLAAENKQNMLENLTIDLMAADRSHIPLDDFTVECGIKRWSLPDIQQRLQRLLYYNIPLTRIKNTAMWPFSASTGTYESLRREAARMTRELEQDKTPTPPKPAPDDAFQYFRQTYDVGARPTDLTLGVEYQPAWGMQLSADPHEGSVLKSNSGRGQGLLRYLCINQWHFTYDIIYPVKVSIRDDKAFAGQGFVFQFAFPVLISRNSPERAAFGYRRFQTTDFGAPEFCTTYGDKLVDVHVLGAMEGVPALLELDGANITYRCFTQECDLGATRDEGGIYRLLAYLPRGCANPLLTATKDGYLPATRQLRSGTDRLDIPLKKLQDFQPRIVVHPYHGASKTWGEPRELTQNERVSLRISLLNSTFEQYAGFPTRNQSVQLVQDTATYGIDAMLFLRDNQIGGYSSENVTIPYETIAGQTTVVIHLVEYLPVAVTDEQKLTMIEYLTEGDYRNVLQPTFE